MPEIRKLVQAEEHMVSASSVSGPMTHSLVFFSRPFACIVRYASLDWLQPHRAFRLLAAPLAQWLELPFTERSWRILDGQWPRSARHLEAARAEVQEERYPVPAATPFGSDGIIR